MRFTDKVRLAVMPMKMGTTKKLNLDGRTEPKLAATLAHIAKGEDFTYSIKFDTVKRVYNITKIKRGTRFNYSRFIMSQVEHLKPGEYVKVDLAGRDRYKAQPTVGYVAELLDIGLSINVCKVTRDVYITRNS